MSKFMSPSILRETSIGISCVDVNDVLLEKREVYFTGEVDDDSCAALLKTLNYLEHDCGGSPIKLYINSPGGCVNPGLAVYDYIRSMKSPITTICIGGACSMGAILFLAGEERLMLPHSEVMIHDASFGKADFSGLKPDEIQEKADNLMETSKTLRDIVVERTGKTLEEVTAAMKKDSFYKAAEAISFGLATGLVKEV